MTARTFTRLALVFLAARAGVAAGAERSPFLPDQAKLQFAGNIGFLSPGAGWSWAGRRLEGDLFLGWVPRAVGGEDIFSLTGKLTWQPFELGSRRWRARPFSAALQVTYTFGDAYWVVLPERYPASYYDFATALRACVAAGASVARRTGGTIREVGVYAEVVAIDAMLFTWFRNRRALGPADVFSLAVGGRVAF